MKVAICIPSGDEWKADFGQSLATLYAASCAQAPASGISEITLLNARGSVLPAVRMKLARDALDRGAEWLLWLDSDMTFPPDCLQRLLSHGKRFVCATYAKRDGSHLAAGFPNGERPSRTAVYRAYFVGFGCNLIHRQVFERVEMPWFACEYRPEMVPFPGMLGEDYYFCEKARAAGFEIFVDGPLSYQLGHVGHRKYVLGENAADSRGPRAPGLTPSMAKGTVLGRVGFGWLPKRRELG